MNTATPIAIMAAATLAPAITAAAMYWHDWKTNPGQHRAPTHQISPDTWRRIRYGYHYPRKTP